MFSIYIVDWTMALATVRMSIQSVRNTCLYDRFAKVDARCYRC